MQVLGTERPHGFFDPDLAPVATVESGETVRFATLESAGRRSRSR